MRTWYTPVLGVLAVIALTYLLLDGGPTGLSIYDVMNLETGIVAVEKDNEGKLVLTNKDSPVNGVDVKNVGNYYVVSKGDKKIILRDKEFTLNNLPIEPQDNTIPTLGQSGQINILSQDEQYLNDYTIERVDNNAYNVLQDSDEGNILVKEVTATGYKSDFEVNPFDSTKIIPTKQYENGVLTEVYISKYNMVEEKFNPDGSIIRTTTTASIDSETGIAKDVRQIIVKSVMEDHNGQIVSVSTMTEKFASAYSELENVEATSDTPTAIEYNQHQQAQLSERLGEIVKIENKLKEYGINDKDATKDGVIVYHIDGGSKLSVDARAIDGKQRDVIFEKNNQKIKYVESSSLFSGDKFMIGKKAYELDKNCDANTPFCLRSGKKNLIELTEAEYKLLDDIDEVANDATNDLNELIHNKLPPDAQKTMENYWRQIEGKTRGQITSVLSAYIDEILGPFSNGVVNAVCGARLYRKETSYDNRISGIPVPKSTYESEFERDFYDEIRTAIGFGEVEALTPKMYRYEVTLKLIGDGKFSTWEFYLRNSCDGKTSADLWTERGSLGHGKFHQALYAGQEGQDMVFECGDDPLCKFNQGCIKLNDEAGPRCFALAGAIEDLCH